MNYTPDYNTCPVCNENLDILSVGYCTEKQCSSGHYNVKYFHYITYYTVDDEMFEFDESGFDCKDMALYNKINNTRMKLGI